jgi:hypothetical protein
MILHHLLREDQTLEEWWERNGLNHDEARAQRKETYLKQLKETAMAMNIFTPKIPNPGSDAARRQGCLCPVMDNNFGDGLGDGKFWTVQDCPIHGVKDENATTDQDRV